MASCLSTQAKTGNNIYSANNEASNISMPFVSSIEAKRVHLRDSILAHISGAKIAQKMLLIRKFGAKNDGKTDCQSYQEGYCDEGC